MTNPARARLFFGAALAIAAAALRAQDTDEVRTYDVRALCAAVAGAEQPAAYPWPVRPLVTLAPVRGPITWGEDLERSDGGATITSLVRFALEAVGEPSTHVTVIPPTLLKVNGPPRAQAAIPAILDELGRVLDGRIEVEISILSDAASRPTQVCRRHVRAGAEVSFEALVRRAYVGGYVGSVAKRARTIDPRVDRIDCGRRAIVRVDPTPDGALVLTVKVEETGVEGPIRTLSLPLEPAATIEMPVAWWAATSASARIENGGALVIGNDAVPGGFWVVRVHAAPTPPSSNRAAVELLPAGAALQPPLRSPVLSFQAPLPSGWSPGDAIASSDPTDLVRDEAPRVRPGLLEHQLRALRRRRRPTDRDAAAVVGDWVGLGADPAFKAAARAVVGPIIAEATRTFGIEARIGTVAADHWQSPNQETAAALAEGLPIRAASAAIAGDRILLLGGRLHAYLKDADAMIAQSSSCGVPIVDSFFTGFSLACEVVPAGPAHCGLDARIDFHEQVGDLEPFATGSKEVPVAELPRLAGFSTRVPLLVPLDSWTLLHSAPLEGSGKQLVVMVRVRAM